MPELFSWINVTYLDRLIIRLGLSDRKVNKDAIPLIKSVQPVTQIDTLLKTVKLETGTQNISAAAGSEVVFETVPAGKRWELVYMDKAATAGNSKVSISDGLVVLPLTATGTTAIRQALTVYLNEGWTISMTTTGNGADTAVVLRMEYIEEDVY